jgi:signal peptidase
MPKQYSLKGGKPEMGEELNSNISPTTAEKNLAETHSRETDFQEEQTAACSSTAEAETVAKGKKRQSGLKKAFNLVENIVFACILIIMVVLVYSMVQSRLSGGGAPRVFGYQMYIVLSGSMSPAFDAGSLILLKPENPENIVEGDIITFRPSSGEGALTTHRVVQVNRDGGLSFITRGDANDVNDQNPVMADKVVGRVEHAVPYAGYLMDFGQSKTGIISLVMIPGVLIIIFELRNLFRYAAEWEAEKAAKKKKESSPLSEEKGCKNP